MEIWGVSPDKAMVFGVKTVSPTPGHSERMKVTWEHVTQNARIFE